MRGVQSRQAKCTAASQQMVQSFKPAMLGVLSNRNYRTLFAAQVIALVGTGLATVALGLLAWELAGGDAGQVMGTALAIKMLAYVILSPVAQAFADRVSRRTLLVTLNLIRAVVAAALPFVADASGGSFDGGKLFGLVRRYGDRLCRVGGLGPDGYAAMAEARHAARCLDTDHPWDPHLSRDAKTKTARPTEWRPRSTRSGEAAAQA